jgi:hypothetical protein
MILSKPELDNIVLNNPNKGLISRGCEYSKELRMHFYGEKMDYAEEMKAIDGFEKPTLRDLRVKYARSNRDITARTTRPVDKIFSAKGGSVYYNLSGAADKKARQLATDIRSGYSIKSWVEHYWKPHFLDDPYGLIFIEIASPTDVARLRKLGRSFVYPTYKSISSIYDYSPNGANFEYVVFTVDQREKEINGLKAEDKVYRVVDDAKDYFVKVDGETVTILNDLTIPNYFGYVPAMRNADVPDPNLEGGVLSLFDEVLELASQYLLKGSIKLTHDFLHGFPKYWEYADDCPVCNGTKFVAAKECVACHGSGKKLMTSVSDAKILSHPQHKDDPIITPNIAGYVSPDKTFWEIATTDLQLLEDLMNYTLWSSSPTPKPVGVTQDTGSGGSKTATEIMTDVKPQADRLHPISESAEKRHKFILDAAVQIQVSQSYAGSSVNYGKRYMLESPDVLWEKYQDARMKGAAASVLDDLLMEYYETKYDSDPVKLAIQSKLMKVEPFVHLTTLQVKQLSPAEEDYKAKLYFSEWLATVNEAMILSMPTDLLRKNLIETVSIKQLPAPEAAKPIAA